MLHRQIILTPVNPAPGQRAENDHEPAMGKRARRLDVNITGLIVYTRPERSDGVRAALAAIDGVDVHAVTPDGRMVVTVEQADDAAATGVLEAIPVLDGVLSTALVYHHDEALDEQANR